MLSKPITLLLIATSAFVPGIVVCVVMLLRTSQNPISDLISLAAFAATVVVVNVAAIRISLARAIRDSSPEKNA